MGRWLAAVGAVLVAVVAVLLLAGGGDPARHAASEREAQATPTPTAAPQASIEPAGISEHLRALRAAAQRGGGTRAAGSPGDAATARYIAGRLRAAGYRVSEQVFRVPLFLERRPPRVSGLRRAQLLTLTFSGSGTAAGPLRKVGLGCTRADFAGVGRGDVALARRGVCTFSSRARLAQRAGARALLVISDRGAPFSGSLGGPGVRIPVLAVSTAAGRELAGRSRVRVRVDAISEMRRTRNVIGEIGPADAARVYMAGGHLDSVVAGPGLNDNGSGVAAVLEVAEQLASRPLAGGAALRVGFWAAEEIGLVGSRRYVDRLSRAERRRIKAYVNLDMVGSPGDAKAAVYAGDGADGRAIEAALRKGLPPGAPEERLGGASDHASFDAAGVPVGGIFTGLDRCYHRSCDRIGNVDAALAASAARATAGALEALAAG
jgi:peptidase M28-like protein/PA domain-containing protein